VHLRRRRGPHLYRFVSTAVAPVRCPLKKNKKQKKQKNKKNKQIKYSKENTQKNNRKKRDRESGRSVRHLLLATVSGSQRAFSFSSFAFIFPFSVLIRTCDQQRL
jgi:hypothetical protein